jgi:two-component system chemotaxis response regulator CheY
MVSAVPSMHRTLVVDDSQTIRRMVMASLRDVCRGGFAEAATGLEAIEQLAIGPVSLMILDLNMPDMHGLEVLRFVKSHDVYRGVPVVVLTTRSDTASRGALLGAGASLYITKPFAPHTFASQVRSLLAADGADAATAGKREVDGA